MTMTRTCAEFGLYEALKIVRQAVRAKTHAQANDLTAYAERILIRFGQSMAQFGPSAWPMLAEMINDMPDNYIPADVRIFIGLVMPEPTVADVLHFSPSRHALATKFRRAA